MAELVLASWALLGCAAFSYRYLVQSWESGALRLLADEHVAPPDEWPRLSVIVAACNEEATLEAALATLLGDDYPNLELVLVDDRSTDGTGALLDRLAARDPRVRAVHVTHLPDGWLGKVHALDTGVRHASGSFLLFTDADVHFRAGALRRAVALCVARKLDHLVVLPDAQSRSFLEEVAIDAVGAMYMRRTRAAHVGEPDGRAYAGVGAFNLVRRDALERSEGFSWLRMEVLDDVGLGLLLRRAGARAHFAIGTGDISLTWYASMREMAGGMEKNLFGWLARYSALRLGVSVAAVWAVMAAPVVALFLPAPFWIASALAGVSLLAAAASGARRTRRRLGPFLLLPVGELILTGLVLRSGVQCLRRRGIVWRGTAYPLDALRAGQRVRQ
jgi:hypothetical protein